MTTKSRKPKAPEPITSQEEWDGLMRKLDDKIARGGSPTAVRHPNGMYLEANSAEDAFFIRLGRADLAR